MKRKTASHDRDPGAGPKGTRIAPHGAADRIAALDPGDLTFAERDLL
jgi:hypothetical protein